MRDYIVTVDESEEELMHYGVLGMKWHHHNAKVNTHLANTARKIGNTKVLKSVATALPPKAAKKYYDKLESRYRANAESELNRNKKNAAKNPKLKNASKYTSNYSDKDAKKAYKKQVAIGTVVGGAIGLAANPYARAAISKGARTVAGRVSDSIKSNVARNKYANAYGLPDKASYVRGTATGYDMGGARKRRRR